MKLWKIRHLVPSNGPETDKAAAVQDTAGKQYRQVNGIRSSGEILSFSVTSGKNLLPTGEECSISNFRIIAPVHPNTVYAVLRRAGSNLKLKSGNWYEVHGD